MAKAVGIDLGTTNSAVAAVMEGGHAEIIPNSEGGRVTPSVPEATIYSAKRFIGRKWNEVEEEARMVSYKVVRGDDDAVRFEVRDKLFAPEEIAAEILRKLTADAAKYAGEKVTEVVVTVPAYFNDAQRQATKDAGALNVKGGERVVHIDDSAAGKSERMEEAVAST